VSERFGLIRDIIVAVLIGQLLIGGLGPPMQTWVIPTLRVHLAHRNH
jgi:hypothetical protein